MPQDPTPIWAGLCLTLALVAYALGYSRRAMEEAEHRRKRRKKDL